MSEAKAILRHVRMAPRKARLVVDMVRGRRVDEALTLLKFTHRSAARVIEQLLFSAVSNAAQKQLGEADNLVVSVAYVDCGPVLKRFQPRAMGRASPIKKRTSHITVVVSSAS